MKAKIYLAAVILLIVIAQSMAFQDEITDCQWILLRANTLIEKSLTSKR
jgi:hypothetical protein